MKGFSERNPIVIAVIGLTTAVVVALAIFYAKDLPVVGAGPTYSAQFSESAGLKPGDDVLVAGVQVGQVSSVSLQGTHVLVKFRVKSAWLGDRSDAAIKIQTLLGQKYLAIDPEGQSALSTSATIPLSRTSSPYDVSEALEGLSKHISAINTPRLGRSFDVLSTAFADTPKSLRSALTGLSALSTTIASRDDQLAELIANTRTITQTISNDDPQLQALIVDGDKLLAELRSRSAAITALLKGTTALGQQLSGLVADNESTLHPALVALNSVTTTLQQNQSNLQDALRLIGPYYSLLDDALGNGRWMDAYICGLFDSQGNPQLDATATRNCAPQAPGGS